MSLEDDTAISTSLAAVGFNRTPLEDEYDSSVSTQRSGYGSGEFLAIPMPNPNPDRHRRSTSGLLNNGRMSILPDAYHEDRARYDPYMEYAIRNTQDQYHDLPSPTSPHLNAPPPSAFGPNRDRSSTDGVGMLEVDTGIPMGTVIRPKHHSHQSSGASLEPLLASHLRNNSGPILPRTGNSRQPSRTPSTENGSPASTNKPLYLALPSGNRFYATNVSSRSALLGDDLRLPVSRNGSVGNLKEEGSGETEGSTVEDGFPKPVLAVCDICLSSFH